ncbi:extracellular solute-binding protein [Zhihengliuella sp.]|uniref:ABC transporter substrate-binding protein n=1 Tax=Zhihengliuella sp. TaxID=1954483 RepID=UPI002811DD92|nr:extracellular solute-binding protein [Zhihengliuella sp.]
MGTKDKKRLAQAVAVAAVSALALTACGGGGESEDGKVRLTFAWWGSDDRSELTEEIIAAFEEQNPDIDVVGSYSDWNGYWDRLATQTAAGDAPDVIQMDSQYLREYADRGALLDLSGVDVSKFDESAVDNGRTEEGLFGITTGVNSPTILANPAVFEEAGVALPDDTTWTWDDYAEISQQISEATDGKYGSSGPSEPLGLQVWLRQQGKALTTEEGTLGFDQADAAEYLQHHLGLMESGSYPEASMLSADQTVSVDQSLMGTGQSAMAQYWTNQVSTIASASGADIQPLRFPSPTGNAEDAGLFYKASMLLSASGQTEHPEEAQQFIDFFVNNVEAGLIGGTERGVPANSEVREAVMAELEGPDKVSAEFVEEIEPELGPSEPIPPQGFSELQNIVFRYETEVYFGRQSPEEAAGAMIGEMEQAIAS